jgi:hypothetical protein
MNNKYLHISVALLLAFFLLALADLLPFWMPNMNEMIILLLITLLILVWGAFIMNEHATDEREVMLRMHAGRIAYLSGIGVLTLALILQGLAHTVDPWIPVTLGVMILTKLGARLYLDRE